MERTADRWDRWTKCISELPVSEYGDPDHRYGFRYDERDGTGLDLRPALAIDTRRRRRPNMVLFEFSRRKGCGSLGTEPTQPGTPGAPGTADPAKLPRSASACAPHEPGSAREQARGARAARGAPGADVGAVRRVGVVPVLDPGDRVRRPGGTLRLRLSGQGRRSRAIGRRLRSTAASGTTPTTCSWAVSCRECTFVVGEATRPIHRRPPTPGTALRYCNDEPGEAVDRPVASRPGRRPRTRYAGERPARGPQARTSTPFSRTSPILASRWRSSTPSINACT